MFNLSNPLSHDLGFLQFLRNSSTINEISSENIRKNKTYYYYPFAAELSIKLCTRSCLTCHVFYQIVNSIIFRNYAAECSFFREFNIAYNTMNKENYQEECHIFFVN